MDFEKMVVSNNLAVAPLAGTASKSGGLGIQCYKNTSHGGAGATPSWTTGAPTAALTAGTGRAFTVDLLNTVCQSIYTNSGAQPDMVVMGPAHKAVFSGFTGIAQNRLDTGKKQGVVLVGADLYIGNFGQLEVVPHYLMSGATDAYVLNTDYIECAFLDGVQTSELGKTGDSEKELITMDGCLVVRTSDAQGKIANLTGG